MVTWLYANWAYITLVVGVGLVAALPRGWALVWLVAACFIDNTLHDATLPKVKAIEQPVALHRVT